MNRPTPSLIGVLVVNAVPLAGVLFLGWKIFPIVFFYWLENIVVGLFNILKMTKAQKLSVAARAGSPANYNDLVKASNLLKVFTIGFFIIHYFGFTAGQGAIMFAIFPHEAIPEAGTWLGLLSLLASHWISYKANYLGRQEYLRRDPVWQMFQPYGRIAVTQVVVILGGYYVQEHGSAVGLLLLLIGLRTVLDVSAHIIEHRQPVPPPVPSLNPKP